MPLAEAPASYGAESRRRAIRIGAIAAAVLASAVCAWQIVAMAQARALADDQPEAALAWRSNDARALSALAERDFLDAAAGGQSLASSRELGRRALRSNPLDVRAMRVLGWVAEEDGDGRRALRLMTLASSRSQRDVASHLWMFHNRLRAQDFETAFAHGDALMRHASTLRETAVLMASAAGADDRAAAALTRRLQTRPSWRTGFVRELAASQDPDVTLSILLAVKESGAVIDDRESASLATRLVRGGRPREAYLAWVLLLPPDGYDVLDNVYNGGFESPLVAGPFAWTLARRGARVGLAPGREGKVLLTEFAGGKDQVLARQTLVLTPGVYRLSINARMDLDGGGRMAWTVSCANGPAGALGLIAAQSSRDWKQEATTLTVPGASCESQRLELRASGSSAWGGFDDVRIQLVGGGA